jgi:hypothetical protein
VVWANRAWEAIVRERSLRAIVNEQDLEALHDWVADTQPGQASTWTLSLTRPMVSFRVAKTTMSLPSPSSSRPPTFHIITSLEPIETPIPSHHASRSSSSTRRCSTPLMARCPPMLRHRSSSEKSVLQLQVSVAPQSSTLPVTDCRQLLETTDWAKTSLGARSTWSPVVETMIRVIMSSPTQDSLWLGPDFIMI